MCYEFCLYVRTNECICATERRLAPSTSNSSIKLPSPAPANAYAPSQRSRLSHQTHLRHSRRGNSLFGADEDAEGEDDFEENGEEGGDPEDKEIYCLCQKLSYGEVRCLVNNNGGCFGISLTVLATCSQMIACDNADCEFQWVSYPPYCTARCGVSRGEFLTARSELPLHP